MKKFHFLAFIIAIVFSFNNLSSLDAQILHPVKWKFEAQRVSDNEFNLVATAKIDKGWFTYSQYNADGGPINTALTFKPNADYELEGKTAEVSAHKKSGMDKIFEMNITKFSDEVQFIQKVRLKSPSAIVLGSVSFQCCDDEKCLPPQDEDFTYNNLKINQTLMPVAPAQNASPMPQKQNTSTATPITIPIKKDEKKKDERSGLSNGIEKPVEWAFTSTQLGENSFLLKAKAQIQKGWHVYSSNQKTNEGPIPTSLKFKPNANQKLEGALMEAGGKKTSAKDPAFGVVVTYYEDSLVYTQKVSSTNSPVVEGSLEYMVCNNEKCLPPDEVPFAIPLGDAKTNMPIVASTPAMPANGLGLTPSQFSFNHSGETISCDGTVSAATEKNNLWIIFLLGFGGGLLALLTPCVFPMIPLTVSYFTKGVKNRAQGLRQALIYGASIIVIYVLLGTIVTTLFGSAALNNLATNPWVNIVFGVLFLIFAVSFFGYYEINLPSSWTNRADSASQSEGLGGIFFMAFTLALVSFSCTGPIIGTLLVESSQSTGFAWGPLVGMFGFSFALALPFGLLAFFPTALKALPRAGTWMNDVKVTLGFLEIALALKFLSNADLIMNTKLLPYELMLALWVLCAFGLGLYFFGKIVFKKDSITKVTTSKKILGIVSIVLGLYLLTGFRYNPTTSTFATPEWGSGILPPAGYSYVYPQRCPLNLNCFHDLNEGLAYAKQVNKPVLIDFTGWNCANCRKMEENVWNKPGVTELIRDKYILISLFTDDRNKLKAPYTPYTSSFDNKLKDTEGKMWADFEAIHFNKNSQPFYVLASPDLKILNPPVAYTPVVQEYKNFLACGLDKFYAGKSLGEK